MVDILFFIVLLSLTLHVYKDATDSLEDTDPIFVKAAYIFMSFFLSIAFILFILNVIYNYAKRSI